MKQIMLLVAMAAVVLTCGLWQPCVAQEVSDEAIITEISITGFVNLPAATQATIRQTVQSQVGEPMDEETVQSDVEALLATGWLFRVTPMVQPVEGGVHLTFTVVENMVVTSLDFIGNISLTDAQLAAVVGTQPGTVLNFTQVTADAQAIKEAYAKCGYTATEITAVNPTDAGRLEYVIFEPTISEIRIEGNRKTRDYVILRELAFQPGDVFNARHIETSLYNLERLAIFDEPVAVPEPGTTPGTFAVVIRVKERRTGLASVGVGNSNIQGLIGFIDVADTNLFGTGQRLSARVQFGANDTYQLTYVNPWFDNKRTSFTASIYDRNVLQQVVVLDQTYEEHRQGGFISFGRPTGPRSRASITLRADKVQATDVPQTILDNIDETLDDPNYVYSAAMTLSHDTRSHIVYPVRGGYESLTGEIATGHADVTRTLPDLTTVGERVQRNYVKGVGEARRYIRLRARAPRPGEAGQQPLDWVYATRLMAGTIGGNPPFLEEFQIGGADTLRGYQEDRFTGRNMLLWNNEARVPINPSLTAVAFVDVGDAWGGEFAALSDSRDFELHVGYGLGVRVQTPIGPLRLDYGWGDESNEFHFGFGSTF